MSENKTAVSGGISFTGALTLLFVTLKLCGVIAWPWLWVLSPLWIPVAAAVGIVAVVVLVATILALFGVIDWK